MEDLWVGSSGPQSPYVRNLSWWSEFRTEMVEDTLGSFKDSERHGIKGSIVVARRISEDHSFVTL